MTASFGTDSGSDGPQSADEFTSMRSVPYSFSTLTARSGESS